MLLIFGGHEVYLSGLDISDLVCGGFIAVPQSLAYLIVSYDQVEDNAALQLAQLYLVTVDYHQASFWKLKSYLAEV